MDTIEYSQNQILSEVFDDNSSSITALSLKEGPRVESSRLSFSELVHLVIISSQEIQGVLQGG